MKSSVYLDTTIPSYLFDERDSIRLNIEVTQKWWDEEANNFDIWASEATLDEISEGHYPKKQELLTFVAGIQILMNDNELLIEKYRTQKILDEIDEHDLVKYVSDTHSRIEALAARFGLDLKYGTPNNAVRRRNRRKPDCAGWKGYAKSKRHETPALSFCPLA